MTNAHAWAAYAPDTQFAPFRFSRRDPGPSDVQIDIHYCGICHSDIHFVRGDWGDPTYPCVPGHEIVGRVSGVGEAVTGFSIGDTVGVGCMVDSCGSCDSCVEGLEQYCASGPTGTYMSVEKQTGLPTYGGYSDTIVVDENFVLRIGHDEQDLAAVAPLLCAGITMWSPLRHWKVGPGKKVGIAGIGGLGHMGIKLAHALGADVAAFTSSASKIEEARRLGANDVIVAGNCAEREKYFDSFDLIISTVSAEQDLQLFIPLLKRDGTLVLVGAGTERHLMPDTHALLTSRRSIAGSLIGSLAETQEMLDFCAQNSIAADVELISAEQIDAAYKRVEVSDVRYRFVIDMQMLAEFGA